MRSPLLSSQWARSRSARVSATSRSPRRSRSRCPPMRRPRRRRSPRDYLRAQIAKFSGDEFEGRAPATPGDEKARQYIVEQLQEIGFKPGGPDGQLAAVVRRRRHHRGNAQAVDASARAARKRPSSGGISTSPAAACRPRRAPIKNAEVVFVGYGIQAPEYGWDDFKGQDLKGKVLLMLNNDPDWDPNAVRRQHAPVLRPLGLQIRERRAPGRGGRDHRAHHAVGGLSVPGRADFVERRAGRSAGGERAARPGRRPG